MTITYRLALAQRGTSGLGAPIISDVFGTIGFLEKNQQPLRFTEVLNGPGALEFALPIDHASTSRANFAIGEREIHLYRSVDEVETMVWGGKLWVADVHDWEVRFIAYGWFYDFTRREVNKDQSWEDADMFDIVRELVDLTQAEDSLGITHYDSSDSGILKSLDICEEERKVIADVFDEFAEEDDGIDFTVLPDKKLRLWHPRGTTQEGFSFDASDNVSEFNYQIDGTKLTTQVAACGEDECGPFVEYFEDGIATYGLLNDHIEGDTGKKSRLRAKAREMLRNQKTPRFQPNVVVRTDLGGPDLLDYDVGDIVTVEASRSPSGGFGTFTDTFRITEREVTFKRPYSETVKLTLDSVVPES